MDSERRHMTAPGVLLGRGLRKEIWAGDSDLKITEKGSSFKETAERDKPQPASWGAHRLGSDQRENCL